MLKNFKMSIKWEENENELRRNWEDFGLEMDFVYVIIW